MSKKLRLSKADYFRSRLQNAIDNKLIEKANYFENRLIAMNEPTYKTEGMEVHNKKLGKFAARLSQYKPLNPHEKQKNNIKNNLK